MCMPLLGLAGGLISGIGGMMQANAQAAQYDAQGKLLDRQAAQERDATSWSAKLKTEQVQGITGEQIAGYGSNGLAVDPMVLEDSARKGALDVAAIRYGGKVRETNLQFEAGMARANASSARAAAPIALLTPILGAAVKLGDSGGSLFGAPSLAPTAGAIPGLY